MMPQFIKSAEKRKIEEALEAQFGISKLPFLLTRSAKEKIRGFSGHLSKEEIAQLSQVATIEVVGLYIVRQEHDLRISFDATHILSNQITKKVLEIEEDQMRLWMRGQDLQIQAPNGTYIIKCKDYFLGCGKSNGQIIINHVPKDRRLRK